jgi:hypothetical protein
VELQIPPLRYPGFPMKNRGIDELHAARFTAGRTRGPCWQRGRKSGFAPVGMTIHWRPKKNAEAIFQFPWEGCRPISTPSKVNVPD